MRPTGFNMPYVVTTPASFSAERSSLGEKLPLSGELSPGRVVWLADEIDYVTGRDCQVYLEDVGYMRANARVISPMKTMPH